MTSATGVKDPVCGMEVETTAAAGQSKYKDHLYYFCSSTCKQKFDAHPEQYVGATAPTKHNDHGCCS